MKTKISRIIIAVMAACAVALLLTTSVGDFFEIDVPGLAERCATQSVDLSLEDSLDSTRVLIYSVLPLVLVAISLFFKNRLWRRISTGLYFICTVAFVVLAIMDTKTEMLSGLVNVTYLVYLPAAIAAVMMAVSFVEEKTQATA